MHSNTYKKILCGGMAAFMLAMTGCTAMDQLKLLIGRDLDIPQPTPKPTVTVEYGTAEPVTLEMQEGVPVSTLNKDSFGRDEQGRITYSADGVEVMTGIDVSEYQGYPDWDKVAADGIDFAMIRLGYRGSSEGMLYRDPIFRYNLVKAHNAGLKVGVYFFSQAVTTAESVEEASMAINAVKGYKLHYPIYFDTEAATTNGSGRADGLGSGQRTDIANAFCQTVRNSGYKAGVYASKSWFLSRINYGALSQYDIWLAHYTSATDFAHRYDMWQYTGSGSCPGVAGGVDLNWAYKVY